MVPETVFMFQFVPLIVEPMVASEVNILGGLSIGGAGKFNFSSHVVGRELFKHNKKEEIVLKGFYWIIACEFVS
jgi:hypothetical protein